MAAGSGTKTASAATGESAAAGPAFPGYGTDQIERGTNNGRARFGTTALRRA